MMVIQITIDPPAGPANGGAGGQGPWAKAFML